MPNAQATPQLATPQKAKRQYDKIALVIGNCAYDKPLAHPISDAALITHRLDKLGYQIVGGAAGKQAPDGPTAGQDLTFDQTYRLAGDFVDAIKPGASVVLYYAGHALQIADKNYLFPVKADLGGDDPLLQLIDLRRIIEQAAERAGATGTVIVFLDACRSNPFSPDQMSTIAEKVVTRSVTLEHGQHGPLAITRGGLAPMKFVGTTPHARTFIGFATAPGDVAYDGAAGANNSPFATALDRHLGIRGLEIEEFYNRVAKDVLHVVAHNFNKVQDPWSESNLNQSFYLHPGSAMPVITMGVAGTVVGLVISLLLFLQGGISAPIDQPWSWFLGLLFGAVLAWGTMTWGTRSVVDAFFAFIGPGFGLALALAIIQMVPSFPKTDVAGAASASRGMADTIYVAVTIVGCIAYFIGIIVVRSEFWGAPRYSGLGFINVIMRWTLPLFIVAALLSLKYFLSVPSPYYMAFSLFAMLAGALYAISAALGMRPQRGLFSGFGPFTGSITVGLLMAVLFVFHSWLSTGWVLQQQQWLLVGLGSFWHGLLGAQLGYCFAYYTPEYRAPDARRIV